MHKILTTFLILFSGILLYSQQSISDILDLDTCRDISIHGQPEYYVGDDLFSLINGGAELYHEYGFVEVVSAEIYAGGKEALRAEIYDMGSIEAAWGIYSMTATSQERPFHAGVAGRKGKGFAQFIKNRFMVYFYFEEIHDTLLQYISGCLVRRIDGYYPRPAIMKCVEAAMPDPEKVIYFRGNLGMSSLYSFHYKDVFGAEEGAAAVYPGLKVFLLGYENDGDCIEHYNTAREFFMNSSKYHDPLSLRGSFHVKDRKDRQIDCVQELPYLLIFIHEKEMDLNPAREAIMEACRQVMNANEAP